MTIVVDLLPFVLAWLFAWLVICIVVPPEYKETREIKNAQSYEEIEALGIKYAHNTKLTRDELVDLEEELKRRWKEIEEEKKARARLSHFSPEP